MKRLLLLVFVVCCKSVAAQMCLSCDQESVKLSYTHDGYSDSSVTFVELPNEIEVYVNKVSIYKVLDKFDATYYFESRELLDGTIIEDEPRCYRIEMNFYCGDCAEYHLKEMLDSKHERWVKVEDGKYITKNKYGVLLNSGKTESVYQSGVMEVIRTPEEKICMTLRIYLQEFKRKEWRRLVKKK